MSEVLGSMPGRRRGLHALKYVALTLFAIPWVVLPLWLILVNAAKTEGDAQQLNLALPETWQIGANVDEVVNTGGYWDALRNSLITTIPSLVVVLLLGAAAAWGFARTRSRWLKVGYYVTALSILLPPALIPSIYLLRRFGIEGTQFGYVLITIASRIGIVVFLATGFFRALPLALEQAAAVDGASPLRTLRKVLLPLVRPVLLVAGVIVVITVWNDFFFATYLLQGEDRQTLPLSLYQFSSGSLTTLRWNLVFAHVVLTSLPLVVVYLIVQRQVISGLTEGALKG